MALEVNLPTWRFFSHLESDPQSATDAQLELSAELRARLAKRTEPAAPRAAGPAPKQPRHTSSASSSDRAAAST
eukprot:6168568-Alexandrium_andersonii.AAC.1